MSKPAGCSKHLWQIVANLSNVRDTRRIQLICRIDDIKKTVATRSLYDQPKLSTFLHIPFYSGVSTAHADHRYVCYHNSELVCGNLAKKTLGDGSKTGLFYTLIREHGPLEAARWGVCAPRSRWS